MKYKQFFDLYFPSLPRYRVANASPLSYRLQSIPGKMRQSKLVGGIIKLKKSLPYAWTSEISLYHEHFSIAGLDCNSIPVIISFVKFEIR